MAKEIIQYVDVAQMQQIISQVNQSISGLTPDEAIKSLSMVNYGPFFAIDVTIVSDSKSSASAGATASEAYLAYKAAGGAISAAGAATVGYSSTAALTAIAAGGGAIGVAGLVSLAPPVAIAVGLAVLGYAAGQLAYQAAPEFWDGLYEKVKEFCFPGTEVVPAVVDSRNSVYIDNRIIEALDEALSQYHPSKYASNIVTTPSYAEGRAVYPLLSYDITGYTEYRFYPDTGITSGPSTHTLFSKEVKAVTYMYTYTDATGNTAYDLLIYAASKEPFTYQDMAFTTTYNAVEATHNNETFYGAVFKGNSSVSSILRPDTLGISPQVQRLNYELEFNSTNNGSMGYRERFILYDILFNSPEASRPEGLEIYTGTTGISSSIGLITGAIGSLIERPYTGVELTEINDNPWQTNSSTSNGPNKAEILNPYLPPEISPSQYPNEFPTPSETDRTLPVPNTSEKYEPDLKPNDNPSTKPDEDLDKLKPEIKIGAPTSFGDSPLIPFPPPDFPSIVSAGSGLIHVYNPTTEEMISFGKWLWVTLQEGGFGIGNYQRLWNNPFDGVIGAFELYANPTVNGRDSIRSGFLACPTQADLVSVRYFNVDCGSLVVPEYYGNYLDYSPYTKAHIYLPFVGIVELNCDDIIGHGVNVTYRIDAYNGSCIATITVAKDNYNALMYQFSGNCAVELPLAGGSQAAIKAGLIGAAATGISSVVTGIAGLATGSVGMMASGISGIGNAISHAVSSKSSVQHSGAFGDSCGAMGNKTPYIIIHRPIQKYVPNYNQIYGFPAHTEVIIGACTGFLRAREVHVESSQATDEEKARIEQMLKEGVIVS